jgi:hypothetical protein
VLTARHPRQRGHRFALGARCDQHDSFRRHQLGRADVDDVVHVDLQVPQLAGDPHVAHHGSADERHAAAEGNRGVDDLLHAIDIGCEAGDDDPTLRPADQPMQRRAYFAFRRPYTGDFRIGRVAQEQIDAGVSEPRHPRQVGGIVVERQLVEFDVAGVQHGARAGVDRDRQTARNRVVDVEVLTLENAVRAPLSRRDLGEDGLDAVLATLLRHQRERELRADQRDVRP